MATSDKKSDPQLARAEGGWPFSAAGRPGVPPRNARLSDFRGWLRTVSENGKARNWLTGAGVRGVRP